MDSQTKPNQTKPTYVLGLCQALFIDCLTYSSPQTDEAGTVFNHHFTEEKPEGHRGEVTCPTWYSYYMAEPGYAPKPMLLIKRFSRRLLK